MIYFIYENLPHGKLEIDNYDKTTFLSQKEIKNILLYEKKRKLNSI